MEQKTPEQIAEERFDREASYIELHRCEGYATAIRELVEPRDRIMQTTVDWLRRELDTAKRAKLPHGDFELLLKRYAELGFEPSNQK